MTNTQIRRSIEGVIKLYSEHPETALSTDRPAVAVIQGGLRCKAEGPNGAVMGTEDTVPPGPLSMRIHIRIAANGVSPEQLRQVVEWAESHSPVGDAVRRAIPSSTEIDMA
jgi:hypothetical protein